MSHEIKLPSTPSKTEGIAQHGVLSLGGDPVSPAPWLAFNPCLRTNPLVEEFQEHFPGEAVDVGTFHTSATSNLNPNPLWTVSFSPVTDPKSSFELLLGKDE